ncbi:hypothetical protein LC605_05845 [Nostoc sp. CHAB 5836]|uniref:hypothetical protein n=1 Tax=Nostoc sp. CHAB 5836 TaxID=2780404 RepID=UPI001E33C9A3|nr:hypothetical protein [Nostoc sp. CHAB 5836]MCC5614606.1 hypothetical protein [Nostoc sp. CHAB 5836]
MPKVSQISFRYNLSVHHDPIISLIYHQKLQRSRLSIDKWEWDDEDTVGNLKQPQQEKLPRVLTRR